MKIPPVSFLIGTLRETEFPKEARPEIAFLGRSNVGKSSLLNALFNRKGLAKTSQTPGKTQTLNFYDVGGRAYFVDLPGYGYAAVPKALKEAWSRPLGKYLRLRKTLRLVVLLLDARYGPTPLDQRVLALIEEAERPTLLVATKWDKVKSSLRARRIQEMRNALELPEDAVLLPVSALTREGIPELWRFLEEWMSASAQE